MQTVMVDTSSMDRILNKYVEQFPYAVARGLTKLAQIGQGAEKKAIGQVFDRPTPFTLKSPVIRPATKETLTSRVFIRDEATKGTPPSKYLQAEVFGGARRQKRSEVALSRYIGRDVYVAPAVGKLDQYGNIRAGEIQKVLASLGLSEYAKDQVAQRRGRTLKERGITYFVGRPGGGRLPYGVWMRKGRKLEPVLIVIPKPTYQPRFHFFEVAEQAVKDNMYSVMMDAEDEAIRTAR